MASIDNLKHFVAVVENQGLIRAADKLFLSASSLTRSIQLLEEEVKGPLFDRIGRTLQLNPRGEAFYKKATELLAQFSSLLKPGDSQGVLRGHFHIGASHFLCENLLAGVLAKISSLHKEAVFEVSSLDTGHVLRKLQRGEMDLGFAFSPGTLDGMQSEVISEGKLYLCADKNHPLMGHRFSELKKKLADFPAVIHRPTDSVQRCDNHPMFKKHGIKPDIQMYWDSDYFAAGVLKEKRHWTLIPDFVIERTPSLKKFSHPEDWNAPYTIEMVWNKNKAVNFLKEIVSKNLN